MAPMPKVKANNWGKADKKYLSNLISAGDVNITDTSYLNIIAVRWSILIIALSRISVAILETSQPLLTLRPSTPVPGNAK
jgi:hypothetical protein